MRSSTGSTRCGSSPCRSRPPIPSTSSTPSCGGPTAGSTHAGRSGARPDPPARGLDRSRARRRRRDRRRDATLLRVGGAGDARAGRRPRVAVGAGGAVRRPAARRRPRARRPLARRSGERPSRGRLRAVPAPLAQGHPHGFRDDDLGSLPPRAALPRARVLAEAGAAAAGAVRARLRPLRVERPPRARLGRGGGGVAALRGRPRQAVAPLSPTIRRPSRPSRSRRPRSRRCSSAARRSSRSRRSGCSPSRCDDSYGAVANGTRTPACRRSRVRSPCSSGPGRRPSAGPPSTGSRVRSTTTRSPRRKRGGSRGRSRRPTPRTRPRWPRGPRDEDPARRRAPVRGSPARGRVLRLGLAARSRRSPPRRWCSR